MTLDLLVGYESASDRVSDGEQGSAKGVVYGFYEATDFDKESYGADFGGRFGVSGRMQFR